MRQRPRLQDILEVIAQYSTGFKRLENTYGEVDYEAMRILIHPDLTAREKLDTLIHEGVHIWYHSREMIQTERKVLNDTKRIMGELDD